MANMLAIITIPATLTKKQMKFARKRAEKRLGSDFRVLVVSGGVECKATPIIGSE